MYLQTKTNERRSLATRSHIGASLDKLRQVSAYNADHEIRVSRYCGIFIAYAREHLGISEIQRQDIVRAALCHDSGKTKINKSILNKTGRLSNDEWREICSHPQISMEIGKKIQLSTFAILGVLHHHERWDGYGYPDRLSGIGIPFSARVIAVADSLDAMVCSRPYHQGISIENALAEINQGRERQFDPLIVDIFRSIPHEIFEGVTQTWH